MKFFCLWFVYTSMHRIKKSVFLKIIVAGMWTKSPIRSFVHISIKPLFPAVPNFCRVQVCKIHLFLWSPGRRKSLSKDLKEKIAAVDRGWKASPTLPKRLFVKNWGCLEQFVC